MKKDVTSLPYSDDKPVGAADFYFAINATFRFILVRLGMVTVDVKVCPAIQHLRANNREIVPCFCQHCYYINEAIAVRAGFTARVLGGNGSCIQTFQPSDIESSPQDLTKIKEASC